MGLSKTIALFLTVFAFSPHAYASEWWLLNYRELTCGPPLADAGKIYTPDVMVKEYSGCIAEPFDEGNGIYLNCDSSRLKTNLIFVNTLEDCKKWAEKLRPLRDQGKGIPKSEK